MILLIYLLNMCFLSQVINASKSENNIVMSGGHGGGCKDSGGGGALVMQNGKKGRAASFLSKPLTNAGIIRSLLSRNSLT